MDLSAEKYYFSQGLDSIAGIDEAGRGPLAGPVVAAAVLLRPDFEYCPRKYAWVRDSKRLSPKRRAEVKQILLENVQAYGIGWCSQAEIDRLNIRQASFLAMKKALGSLPERPRLVLVDGRDPIPNFSADQKAIIGGDNCVFVIAAASIIAKEYRDDLMRTAHQEFPQYGFDQHKGYGTKAHLEALAAHGPCAWHRRSFAPVRNCSACEQRRITV